MGAFIWNANPKKWNVVPPSTNGWDALRNYVSDHSGYVYWSTPQLHRDIRVGDQAFIWRTRSSGGLSGLIAAGTVEEPPQDILSGAQFSRPDRLRAAGWSEANAPSSWKTGIRIATSYWIQPLQLPIRISQGTVRRLSDEELVTIRREISNAARRVVR
jgi:hypothetical protein